MVTQYVYMVTQYAYNWYTSALLQDTGPQYFRHSRLSHCRSSFTIGDIYCRECHQSDSSAIYCCCHYYNTPLFPY